MVRLRVLRSRKRTYDIPPQQNGGSLAGQQAIDLW
jgi:hypothetical protein